VSDRLALAIQELAEALREELRTEAEAGPRAPDRLLSVDEAAAMLGIGRSRLYTEIGAGRIRSTTVGRRRLLSASAVRDFIDGTAA
jgi:excisionase family DNA binding protein